MTEQHSITPPPELLEQWRKEWHQTADDPHYWFPEWLAVRAAQWGADQELEACCEWLAEGRSQVLATHLRAARRPKPPSLKQQALEALKRQQADTWYEEMDADLEIIGRALEQLDD